MAYYQSPVQVAAWIASFVACIVANVTLEVQMVFHATFSCAVTQAALCGSRNGADPHAT